MSTRVVEKRLLRWAGSRDDLRALAERAGAYIQERTGTAPQTRVTTTFGDVETRFDSFAQFETGIEDDFAKLQTVVVTVGEFDRDVPLAAELTFSSTVNHPGATVKVRGHEDAFVHWLSEDILERVERGGRRLRLSNQVLVWIIVAVFLVAQYFFYQYVPIPRMGELGEYLLVIVATFLPMIVIVLCLNMLGWLVPQFEPLQGDGKTRWQRHKGRTMAASSAVVSSVVLPLALPALRNGLGIGE